MSEKDFLTGCLSKEAINPTLDKIMAECKVNKIPFSVLVIDLDHFKAYNDKYGHIDGDDVIKYFASTLRLSFGEDGIFIFRFGGDEFMIVFSGKGGKEANLIANNVIKNLRRRPFLFRGRIFKLSFSAGIASYPSDGNEIEAILQKADRAMYFSKTHGRGKVTLYSHMLRRTVEKILLIFMSILIVATAVFYFNNSSYKDYAVYWLKNGMGKASAALAPASIRVDSRGLDIVYLKSGRILKGIIVRDDEDNVELNLSFETGRGSITIKRSDIEKISNRPDKGGRVNGHD
ncbi:MAG: GGDEF domain-containing protein [Candidatus Omnitrophota bacterium]|nr:GGDEF domain-containing protein [Candidatus Omnitrophota bacterium]